MKNVSTTTTASDYADYAIDGDPGVDPYAYALIVLVGSKPMSLNINNDDDVQHATKVASNTQTIEFSSPSWECR